MRAAALCLALAACSSDGGQAVGLEHDSGPSTGGAATFDAAQWATGGAQATSGGASATGGTVATGGAPGGSGGAATGGVVSTGGAESDGGPEDGGLSCGVPSTENGCGALSCTPCHCASAAIPCCKSPDGKTYRRSGVAGTCVCFPGAGSEAACPFS